MEKGEDRKLIKKYIDTQGNTIDVFIDKAVTVTTPGGERVLTISPKGDLDIQDPEGKHLKANVFINRDLFIKELNEWKLATLTYENEDSQSWALNLYPQEQSLYEDADFLKIVNFYWKAWDKLLKLRPEEEQEEAKAHLDGVFPDYLKEALERSWPSNVLQGTGDFAGIADIPADSEELEGQTNLFEDPSTKKRYNTESRSNSSYAYRTDNKAVVPSDDFRNGFSIVYYENGVSVLPSSINSGVIRKSEDIITKGGSAYLSESGEKVGLVYLVNRQTREAVLNYDPLFLKFAYNEFQRYIAEKEKEGVPYDHITIRMRVAKAAELQGIESNFGEDVRSRIINDVTKYNSYLGFFNEGGRRYSVWPVLTGGYDSSSDEIVFSSMYIDNLIRKQREARKNKADSLPRSNKKRLSEIPINQSVLDNGIFSARDHEAANLAFSIATFIKRAGADSQGRSKAKKTVLNIILDSDLKAKYELLPNSRKRQWVKRKIVNAFKYIEMYGKDIDKYGTSQDPKTYKDFALPKLTSGTKKNGEPIYNFNRDTVLTFVNPRGNDVK